eukprot:8398782-Alexandrium_andersonii.AAC.1
MASVSPSAAALLPAAIAWAASRSTAASAPSLSSSPVRAPRTGQQGSRGLLKAQTATSRAPRSKRSCKARCVANA